MFIPKLIPESELNIAKNIKTVAQDVLLNESRTDQNPGTFIDSYFEEYATKIYSSQGSAVTTSIGKSAIIANKIMSTLNLTSTPSVFMHTVDVFYGESGTIQREMIRISILKSDNTTEFKALVPLLKQSGTKLVALRPQIMNNQFLERIV